MKKMLILALLTGAPPVLANWGGDSGGSVATGTFRASGTEQVEMQNENLDIRLFRDRASIRVNYVLKNTGPAVDVKAGFPCLGLATIKKNYLEIENYQLDVDGIGVAHKTERGDVSAYQSLFDEDLMKMPEVQGEKEPRRIWWLSSTVHFEPGQVRRVRVAYESLYEYSLGGPSNDCYYNNDYFRYLLSTAGVWKGPIQKGRITIEAADIDAKTISLKPEGRFKPTPQGFVWTFRDLSPTLDDNIEICLNNKLFTQSNSSGDPHDQSWYSFEGPEKRQKYYFNYHKYSARASSQAVGYPASNVADFKKETAWVASRHGGVGESLTLILDRPEHIEQIGIVPGYGKSKELYYANSRIRELNVSVNGGAPRRVQFVDDYMNFDVLSPKGYQMVDLGSYAGAAKTITLTIKRIYPGSRHNETCVSEVLLRKRFDHKPPIQHGR